MTVLGIDPGYARLGWAVLKLREEGKGGGEEKLVACGCIETNKSESHERRLAKIANETRKLFEKYKPTKLAIEKLLFTKNQTTGIAVAESRGVVLAVAGAFRCEVKEIGPMQVKLAVAGYGHADKKQVQDMVKRLLKLKKTLQPDDAADACAIALSCMH